MAVQTVRHCIVCNSEMNCLSLKRRYCSDKCRIAYTRKLRKTLNQPETQKETQE